MVVLVAGLQVIPVVVQAGDELDFYFRIPTGPAASCTASRRASTVHADVSSCRLQLTWPRTTFPAPAAASQWRSLSS